MSNPKPHLPGPVLNAGSQLAALRAQVLERARQQPAPTRAQLSARQRFVIGLMLLAPLLVFIAWGGVRLAPRPERLVLETLAGSLMLSVAVAIVALGRGRSMLGRPRAVLMLVVILTPVLLFTWRVLASARYSELMVEWTERPGVRCLVLSSMLAVVPLLGLLWMRRGSDPVHPRMTAAAFGAAVGAGAWVFVDLWCPVGYVPHLLIGHVAPLILLIALSALFGSRMLRVQRSSRPEPTL